MKISINANWCDSGYGYIIGQVNVLNNNGDILMNDTDMYFNLDKFIKYINKTFMNNSRFKFKQNAKYYKDEQRLEIIAEDLKGA